MPVAGTGPKNGITLRLSREGMMPYKNASYQACCKAYYTDPHEAHVRPICPRMNGSPKPASLSERVEKAMA